MTRDEVVALTRQCAPAELKNGRVNEQKLDDLMALVRLIVAAERERCAQVCEKRYMGDNTREDQEALRCAAAIRGRAP